MRKPPLRSVAIGVVLAAAVLTITPAASIHPRLLFDAAGLDAVRAASKSELAPIRARLMDRAQRLLTAAPLLVSTTKRGEPDPPGHLKGIEAARRLQGRVLTYGMAFLLSGEKRYRNAAVAELDHALEAWPIWVDTAHQPPYDLMTGELSMTYGIAYDWLYDALTPAERTRMREGAERRSLRGYLDVTTREPTPFWLTATMNWNTVTNGGATMLALALGEDSALSERVLTLAAPAMAHYWNHLEEDGAWAEGTGYWTYGHRYAFIAADALRRAGRPEGAEYLGRPGARTTGYFPIVFNPGRTLSASFGDSPSRAQDPILHFLAREYRTPDFSWFQDRAAPQALAHEGWPEEALELVWKTPDRGGSRAPAKRPPQIPAVKAFASIGWAMMTPSQPDPSFFLAFKNGSLAAAHTHLDLNHVSIAVGDTMVVPDLGSRPYPADYFDSKKRNLYYETLDGGPQHGCRRRKRPGAGKAGCAEGTVRGRTLHHARWGGGRCLRGEDAAGEAPRRVRGQELLRPAGRDRNGGAGAGGGSLPLVRLDLTARAGRVDCVGEQGDRGRRPGLGGPERKPVGRHGGARRGMDEAGERPASEERGGRPAIRAGDGDRAVHGGRSSRRDRFAAGGWGRLVEVGRA